MKVKEGFELQNVCGEHIIIPAGEENVDFSNIISLNQTAAFLWEKISEKGTFTIEDMVKFLLEEYEVDEPTAREDCELIAERFKEIGVIE